MVDLCVRIDRAVSAYNAAREQVVERAEREVSVARVGMQTRKRKDREEEEFVRVLTSCEQGKQRLLVRCALLDALATILSELSSDDSEVVATIKQLQGASEVCKAASATVKKYSYAFERGMSALPAICGSVEGPFAGGEIFRPDDPQMHRRVRTGDMLLPQVPGTLATEQLQRAVFSARNALTAPWHPLADSAFKYRATRMHPTMAVAALARRTSLLALSELLAGQLDIAIYRNEAALALFETPTVGGRFVPGGFVEHARRWYVDPARLAFYATADGNRAAVADVNWCDGQFLVRDQVLAADPVRSQHDRAAMAIVANVAYVALWAVGVKRAREIAVEDQEMGALEVAEALCGERHMPRGMFAFDDVPTPPGLLTVCADMLASGGPDRQTLARWRRRLLDAFATLADCIESTYSVRQCDYGTSSESDHAFVQSNSRIRGTQAYWGQIGTIANITATRMRLSIRTPTFSGAFSRAQVLFVAPRLKHLYEHGGISERGLTDALKMASSNTLTAFARMVQRQGLSPDVLGTKKVMRTSSGEDEIIPLCVDCTFHGEPSLGEGVTRTIAEAVIREYCEHECALLCISSASNIVELTPTSDRRKAIQDRYRQCNQCAQLTGIDDQLSQPILHTAASVALSFYIQMASDKFGPFMIGPLLAAALSRATFSARTLAPLFYACHPTKLLSELARVYLSDDGEGATGTVGDKFHELYRPSFERMRAVAPKFTEDLSGSTFTLDVVGGLMYRVQGVYPSDLVAAASLDSLDSIPLDDLRTLLLAIFDFPGGHWRLQRAFDDIKRLTKDLLTGVTGTIGASIVVEEYLEERSIEVNGIAMKQLSFTSKFDRFISTRLSIQRQQARDAGRSSINHDPAIVEFKRVLDATVSRLEVERATLYTANFLLTESREVLMQLYETITGERAIHGAALIKLSRTRDELPKVAQLRAVVDCLMSREVHGGHILRRSDFEATAWTFTLTRCEELGNELAALRDLLDVGAGTIFMRMSSLGTSGEDVPYLDTVSTCERSWRQAAWPTYAIYRERMDLLLAQRLHFTVDELQNTVYDT